MGNDRAVSPLVIVATLAAMVVVLLGGVAAAIWAVSVLSAPAVVAPAPVARAGAASETASPQSSAAVSASPAAEASTPAGARPTAKPAVTRPAAAPTPKPTASSKHTFVVVIDPGHQAKADDRQEPIGPGATQTKPAVASGTEGVVTHDPENVINLDVSLKLRDVLARLGDIKVVMIRTTANVDIPNSERAKIANRAHADVFVRIHCDGVGDPSVHGLLTLVPAANRWTGPIVSASAKAGRFIQAATLKATGARDRGIQSTGDMSGFNWSTVPSVIVEMGVMTNPTEDRRLASGSYQTRLAQGMSDGIVQYLHSLR